jgi:mannonate dehydratase
VPVAEEAQVRLATHPDDPPLEYYRGVHRALVSFKGFRRLVELVPSACNGLLVGDDVDGLVLNIQDV